MSSALYNVSATRDLPEWNVRGSLAAESRACRAALEHDAPFVVTRVRHPLAGGAPVALYRVEPSGVAGQLRRVNI